MSEVALTGHVSEEGPVGCVVRFIRAGTAGDNAAALEELHPDSRAGVSGEVHAPPGVTAVEILEPETHDENVHVPTSLSGPEGEAQRFVFVARPYEDRWGVDLEASMKATFGCDPMEMMEQALRSAVEPLGQAMSQMGDAIGDALGGSSGGSSGGSYGSSDAPQARRIGLDEEVSGQQVDLPVVSAHVLSLEYQKSLRRSAPDEEFHSSAELHVKCGLSFDAAWTAQRCSGVTVEKATSVEGEDLRPQDASEDLGSENYASWERERRECYFKVPLAAPQQPFGGLAELEGTVRLDLQGGEYLEVALGPVGDLLGRPVRIAALPGDLEFGRDESGSLFCRAPYGWFDRVAEMRPTSVTGEDMGDSWSQSGDGEHSVRTWGLDFPDDASLRVRFWSRTETAAFWFSVEGLPVRLG